MNVHSRFSHNGPKLEIPVSVANTVQIPIIWRMGNNLWYIYTTKYYSAMKMNELLILEQHGWVSKSLCSVSERSVIPLMRCSRKGKTIRVEYRSITRVMRTVFDYKGYEGTFGGWLWRWLHSYIHLSEHIKLYMLKVWILLYINLTSILKNPKVGNCITKLINNQHLCFNGLVFQRKFFSSFFEI